MDNHPQKQKTLTRLPTADEAVGHVDEHVMDVLDPARCNAEGGHDFYQKAVDGNEMGLFQPRQL